MVPGPLLFNRVSLDTREVRLGTDLESRNSSIFYPLTPKSRLILPLERFPHMNVLAKLRSRDLVRPLIWDQAGCTKTRNGEIRNGKWRNAEMRKWRVENKDVAARGSAVTHKQWQRQSIGKGKCACQSK